MFALLAMSALLVEPTAVDDRARLVVLTDISSLTPGVAEPDDGQSLIRLMLYSNEFDIEGLIATSTLGHGRQVRPDLIRQVVDAYAKVEPNLRRHDPRYPAADRLRATIKAGREVAGPGVPVEDSVGEGKDSEASDWIIRVVDRPDPREVWVVIWGGSADLAQALDKVRRTRSAEEASRFHARLRVHSIGDQDSTGPWIRREFPRVSVIVQQRAYRGMYRGGDPTLVSSEWVESHIHGHGPLGDLYPNYNGGDIWSNRLGRVRGIKEGDTPSFLALVPNGLGDRKRPEFGSWGGRFDGAEMRRNDVADLDLVAPTDPDPRMSSVHRWRPAFQADFQARLDWCVRSFAEANHPPLVRIEGAPERTVGPGETLILDATGSTDVDRDDLRFAWSVYPAFPERESSPNIVDPDKPVARLRIEPALAGKTIPILLTVQDRGDPPLTRYGRVRVEVSPRR